MGEVGVQSPVLQSCIAPAVEVNLDPSHGCSLEPWERGQGQRGPSPSTCLPLPQASPQWETRRRDRRKPSTGRGNAW